MILAAPFGLAVPPRQPRLAAVERLDLAPLVDAEHHRSVRRSHPTMSHAFSSNGGSVESLKVRQQSGCRPRARQTRWIVEGAWPTVRSLKRKDQCTASAVLVSSVRPIVLAVDSSPICRGARARFVAQNFDASLDKSTASFADRIFADAEPRRDRLVLKAICRRQYDPRPLRQPSAVLRRLARLSDSNRPGHNLRRRSVAALPLRLHHRKRHTHTLLSITTPAPNEAE